MTEAERLAERLEALLAKATPPVWIADGKDIVHADGPQAWGKKEVANVALIVEAVNALPTLLARIAALEDALRVLLDASERHIFGDECLAERVAARLALGKGSE